MRVRDERVQMNLYWSGQSLPMSTSPRTSWDSFIFTTFHVLENLVQSREHFLVFKRNLLLDFINNQSDLHKCSKDAHTLV